MQIESFCDKEFGEVKVRYNARARRVIFRVKDGALVITAPVATSLNFLEKSLNEKREAISILFSKSTSKTLQPGDVIETRCFTIKIHTHSMLTKMLFSLKEGVLNVFIPQRVRTEDAKFQKLLKQNILKIAKKVSYSYLSVRLKELAQSKGLTYNKFSVSTARTRMGVCTGKRDISLSAYLIFYPQHLVDYVILHELAHLTEMNHGPRFHALCNTYCNGKERELEREFKKFRVPL